MVPVQSDASFIVGGWRLVSAQVGTADPGEACDRHGANPLGVAVFSSDGRVGLIITASKRRHRPEMTMRRQASQACRRGPGAS